MVRDVVGADRCQPEASLWLYPVISPIGILLHTHLAVRPPADKVDAPKATFAEGFDAVVFGRKTVHGARCQVIVGRLLDEIPYIEVKECSRKRGARPCQFMRDATYPVASTARVE